MAIVTFWNNTSGRIGQTYSAMAVAAYMSVEHNRKTILISTRNGDNVSTKAFIGNNIMRMASKSNDKGQIMDTNTGLIGMSKLVSANRLSPDIITDFTRIVYKNRLEIVAQHDKMPDEDYRKIYKDCKAILTAANRYYDIVFADINNGLDDPTTSEILAASDIIILNMEQKKSEMERIAMIKENKELFPDQKILILVNNLDRKSKYNTKNMTREMSERREVLSVPYSDLYADACDESTAAEFFINIRLKKITDTEDRTGFFMKELNRASEAIIYRMQELQMRV